MASSGPPPPRTPSDIFPAPVLSPLLSFAGPFARNEEPAAARGDEVEDRSEGGGGKTLRGGLRLGEVVEISSGDTGKDACHEDAGHNKSRKSCHRHEAEKIRILEEAFKKSSHPDEKQRQQLSEQLGLSALQVKFWFQNRRSKIKTNQERHENSLLKPQLDKLKEQNHILGEIVKKLKSSRSPTCSVAAATNTEEQMLRLENDKLTAEVERLRRALGNDTAAPPSCDDKAKFLELAGRALDELTVMCSSEQPLWARSVETSRDVLNYDEYARLFRHRDDIDDSGDRQAVWSVEASRETGVVYCNATQLVHAFMDVNQWKEMFPSMITKASTLEVVHAGDNDHLDGLVQLMFAEVQTLTPLVPTRALHFLRHCKKLGTNKWAIVDVSLDNFEPGAQTTSSVCLKKPSGCIVEEQSLGHRCKVTWVEQAKCRNAAVPSVHRARMVTAIGMAFGARRWVAALRLQCERMVFSVASNIPTRASNGIDMLSGRQSVLKLAQRMTSSLYRVISASRDPWRKALNDAGTREIRVTYRESTGEHGEPQGLIACAVLSVWLPVNPAALFGFLLDESRRHQWDLMMPGQSVQSFVTVRKGDDSGNCVTAYAAKSSAEELRGKWIIQDSSTSPCESTVAYVPVGAAVLRPVLDGHGSSAVAVLPCGFVVMPEGVEARPAVITSRKGKEEDRTAVESARSLLTLAFQGLVPSSSATDAALRTEAVKDVTRLAFFTLGNIQRALRCRDC